MPSLNLFNSFRVRLLLVLALLLVATLGVQFALNRRADQRVARRITDQEQALATAFSLAVQSFSTTARLKDLDKNVHFFEREKQAGRRTTRGATTSSSCSAQPAHKTALRFGNRRARSCRRLPCYSSPRSSQSFSSGVSRARFKICRRRRGVSRPAISIFACPPPAAPT